MFYVLIMANRAATNDYFHQVRHLKQLLRKYKDFVVSLSQTAVIMSCSLFLMCSTSGENTLITKSSLVSFDYLQVFIFSACEGPAELVGPVSAWAPVVLLLVPSQQKHSQCESTQVSTFTSQHLLHRCLNTRRKAHTLAHLIPSPQSPH